METSMQELLAERFEKEEVNPRSGITLSTLPVAVNFVAADIKAARLCSEAFLSENIDVWPSTRDLYDLENGADLDAAASQALLSCQVYVSLLSKDSVTDKLFCDRTSLAYVDNKIIEPVGLGSPSELKVIMNPGLRLIILTINWLRVRNESQIESVFKDLVSKVKEKLEGLDNIEMENEIQEVEEENESNPHKVASLRARVADIQPYRPGFWDRKFPDKIQVGSAEFIERVRVHYGDKIDEDFGDEWGEKVMEILNSDVIEGCESITRNRYDEFIGKEDSSDLFYSVLKDYTTGTLALQNILSMTSTVRLTVIRNMGKFSTKQVIKLLRKMLEDPDPNVRAVAALSLGKCNNKHVDKVSKTLIDMLYSPLSYDRLVRESVVLALGQLQLQKAIPILSHLWRNDPIKDVREAADIALEKIGGEDVEHLRNINQKLTEQVQYLRLA